MADFIQEGKSMEHVASGAVTAGDVLLKGEKIVVAKHDIADTETGTVATQGVFDFPKTAVTVYAVGVKVFWDVADQEATEAEDVGTNRLIGYVAKAALSADALVRCYLVNDLT